MKIIDKIKYFAQHKPNQLALKFDNKQLSYKELLDRIEEINPSENKESKIN